MVFDVITPQKYKKEHTKQNKPKENFISMQKNICREAHTMHPYSLHHAIQFQLYYQTILPILCGNLAEISAQYGWDYLAIWLGLERDKAEGVLPLMRPDFTWPCPPVHRAGH